MMGTQPGPGPHATTRRPGIVFTDVTAAAGVQFQHDHGGTGLRYMIETMGGGGGFLDIDGDGHLDIYLVQSGAIPGAPHASAPTPAPGRHNALYRNRGDGTFEDITAAAGAAAPGYGMGACFGDIDNDGDVDIYVTRWGQDALLRNNGDRTVTDVTLAAGIDNRAWAASCAFADYDRDGCLDLFVVNYLAYGLADHQSCRRGRIVGYCHPDVYPGAADALFRGRCDGRFTDVSAADKAGVAIRDPAQSKGLGLIWTDYDGDGDSDVYVANDSTRNFLWRNNGDGTFTDVAVAAGAAYNELGATEAGMGVAAGDYDGDDDIDLFVTHLDFETNTLYRNDGGAFFDATSLAGLAAPSLTRVGFGANFADFDRDGDLDLFVANGHILDNIAEDNGSLSYAQGNQVFENEGGRMREVSAAAGAAIIAPSVSRASAVGDYDNDGDLDVLVVNNHGAATLLRNDSPGRPAWLGLALASRHGGRVAVGARVTVVTAAPDAPGLTRATAEIYAGSSYLSQSDPRLIFGFASAAARVDHVLVRWPDGEAETIAGATLRLGAMNTVRQASAAGAP